jgi:hypothetical protein
VLTTGIYPKQLKTIRVGDWSQMPVVDNHGAETKSTTVRQVLDHTEHPDQHWQIVSKDISIGEALEAFIVATSEGYGLDALVITHAGRKDQKPMGIVTVCDIQKLTESVGPLSLWYVPSSGIGDGT